MGSFLEQINNAKKNGTAMSVPTVGTADPDSARAPEEKTENVNAASSAPSSAGEDSVAGSSGKENSSAKLAGKETSAPSGHGVPQGIHVTEHEAVVDKSYFKKKLLTGGIAALTVIVLACLAVVLIWRARLVTVKDFTGRSAAEMRKWAAEYGLVLDEQNIYSEDVSEGLILTQDIREGTKLSPKSVIAVTVSSGVDPQALLEVPDLESMTGAQVREWINKHKLSATKIVEAASETVARGHVIEYRFGSVSVDRTNFRRGDSLTVYVSTGSRTTDPGSSVRVPDYSKIGKNAAADYDKNVKVTVREVYSTDVPFGGFVSQSVTAGERISKDTTVVVCYSVGKPLLAELKGKSEGELAEIFYKFNQSGANLTYRVEYVTRPAPRGQIVGASRSNEYVSVGEEIVIYVCSVDSSRVVPDFSRLTREQAQNYAETFKLKIVTVYDNKVPYGALIRQSVAAGETLSDESETVVVTYSLGRPYLPDLKGKSENELAEFFYNLNQSGAKLGYRVEYGSYNAPKGQVVYASQYDTFVSVGDTITLRVCNLNTAKVVPDFSRLSRDEAAALANGQPITIKTVYSNKYGYGKFISQSAPAGSNVDEADGGVVVTYSLGLPFIPDMTGRTMSDLIDLFAELNAKGAKLEYSIMTTYGSGAPKGTITSASERDDYVSVGTKLVFVIAY